MGSESSTPAPFVPCTFGRYQLVERLAVGGMAEIFRAKQVGAHGFEKVLVIKRMLPHLAAEAEFLNMFIDDPNSVRYDARVKAGKATIDGVSIADRAKATDLAKKIVAFRADYTVAAINKALAASKGSMQ